MDTNEKNSWEKLPAAQRDAWVQHVINFYPPGTVTPAEAAELARDEYNETDDLLPRVAEICEAD